jgi:hypothetical protein
MTTPRGALPLPREKKRKYSFVVRTFFYTFAGDTSNHLIRETSIQHGSYRILPIPHSLRSDADHPYNDGRVSADIKA